MWTAWVVGLFSAPGVALLLIEPLTFPVALLCFAHAWAVPSLQARRGARAVVAIGIGEERRVARRRGDGPERVALGLLADLVGRDGIDVVRESGFAPYRGELGFWLVGEQGAFLVRDGARRAGASSRGACASATRMGCLPRTGWRICSWRFARTRRALRRSRT